MKIVVRFFASVREQVGRSDLCVEVDQHGDINSLHSALASVLPTTGMQAITAEGVSIAVNQELVNDSLILRDGDEVAFLPPITGG